MPLLKYRLVNVEGVAILDTHAGRKRLEKIDDQLAAELHARGSRYVQKLPDPEPLADIDAGQSAPPPEAAPAPTGGRRKAPKAS